MSSEDSLKKLRFIVYCLIIIVYFLFIRKIIFSGFGGVVNYLFDYLWLCLILIVELIYSIFYPIKHNILKISLLIMIIVLMIAIGIYLNKKRYYNYICSCNMAYLEECDKDYKDCKVYDENNNLLCTIDCSKHISKK